MAEATLQTGTQEHVNRDPLTSVGQWAYSVTCRLLGALFRSIKNWVSIRVRIFFFLFRRAFLRLAFSLSFLLIIVVLLDRAARAGMAKHSSYLRMTENSLTWVVSILEPVKTATLWGLLTIALLALFDRVMRLHRIQFENRRLARSMMRFGLGDLDSRAPKLQDSSASVLAQNFNHIADELVNRVQELTVTDASRRDLVAHVSHDLLKPLAAVRLYLETVQTTDKEGTDTTKDYLKAALSNVDRLDRLVSEFLELSRLENGQKALKFETVPIGELIHNVFMTSMPVADERRIRLIVDGNALNESVQADIALLERTILNLVDNAIRYSPIGSPVRVRAQRLGKRVAIAVEDRGIGMHPEELDRAGEPLYRAPKHGFPDEGGSGLGLAICKKVIKAHGSELEIESEPLLGTTVSFDLPVASDSDS